MEMTHKQRKKLKHSLKTDIDWAEMWISLALTGYEDGVNEYPETSKTREVVVSNLNEARAKIQEKTEKYFELIDDAIKKIS